MTEPDRRPPLNPSEPVPDEWLRWVRQIEAPGTAPNVRDGAGARLQIALLMADLQHRGGTAAAEAKRQQAQEFKARVFPGLHFDPADRRASEEREWSERRAAEERDWAERRAAEERTAADARAETAAKQGRMLAFATVVLAAATIGLFVATLALVFAGP